MSSITWTDQQLAIFHHVETSKQSLIVKARAGVGKTFTGVEIAKRARGKVFFGAFNKSIAEEIQAKVSSNPRCTGGTFHSIAYKLLREIRCRCQVDSRKVSGLTRELHPYDKKIREIMGDAVGFAKLDGLGLDGMPSYKDEMAWRDILESHDMMDEIPASITDEKFIEDCIRVFGRSVEMFEATNSVIDFNDMLYAPLYLGAWKPQRFDMVIVDEAQDTNETRLRIAQSILVDGGMMVAIGDDKQCQPRGTRVAVVIEKSNGRYTEAIKWKPIERVKIGDAMISYRVTGSYFRKCNKVTAVSKRKYTGNLVKVSIAHGPKSYYTENHHCVVNFKPFLNHYGVYLMQKGEHYRVGYSRMSSSSRCTGGPRSRLKAEVGDACWLLTVVSTRNEARELESIISANFGLPQLMFTPKNNTSLTEEELKSTWSNIDGNYDRT